MIDKVRSSILHRPGIYKNLFILILLCVIHVSLVADAYPQNKAGKKSFLWSVKSKTSTVYVLGSIHAMKKEIYPLPDRIERAFNDSDALAVEVNVNELGFEQIPALLESSLYTGDDTLEKHISGETYALVETKLRELGVPIAFFNKSKPWFIALMITSLEVKKMGFAPEYGIDMHFLIEARGKKKIVELESMDYQLGLFDSFSDAEQELFLLYTLKDLSVLDKEVNALVKAWSSGDAKTVESIMLEGAREDSRLLQIHEKLIYERNRSMADKIEGYLNSGEKYFVIVGAGHLVGKRGIIEILRGRGYSIEQL